jgi:hypothetical protein
MFGFGRVFDLGTKLTGLGKETFGCGGITSSVLVGGPDSEHVILLWLVVGHEELAILKMKNCDVSWNCLTFCF